MTSKYAPQRQVPEGFPEELRFFTREALRNWSLEHGAAPDSREWLMQYAHTYFSNGGREALLEARRMAAQESGGLSFPGPEELQRRIAAIFHEADRDGNHFLDRKEFKACLKMFAKELDLTVGDLRHVQVYADENGDGMVSYEEFVPVAVELLQAIFAKRKYEMEQEARQQSAAHESATFLMNGMPQEELDAALAAIFQAADTDGSGALDRGEFMKALKDSDLGLTKKQIHLLADEADLNGDGMIVYSEALPVMFGLLTQLVAKQLEYDALPLEEQGVADYLLEIVGAYDPAADGTVDYRVFAARAANMLSNIIKVAADSEKSARLLMERSRGVFAQVNGFDRDNFSAALGALLGAIDPEGTGRAHIDDLRNGLVDGAGSGLVCSEDQAGALVNLALEGEWSEDGRVALGFVHQYAFDTLQSLQELEALVGY